MINLKENWKYMQIFICIIIILHLDLYGFLFVCANWCYPPARSRWPGPYGGVPHGSPEAASCESFRNADGWVYDIMWLYQPVVSCVLMMQVRTPGHQWNILKYILIFVTILLAVCQFIANNMCFQSKTEEVTQFQNWLSRQQSLRNHITEICQALGRLKHLLPF